MFFSVQDAAVPEGSVDIVWRHRLHTRDDDVDGRLPRHHNAGFLQPPVTICSDKFT